MTFADSKLWEYDLQFQGHWLRKSKNAKQFMENIDSHSFESFKRLKTVGIVNSTQNCGNLEISTQNCGNPELGTQNCGNV